MSKTITIDELIPLLKKGWVAMDENGSWYWFNNEPIQISPEWYVRSGFSCDLYPFNIAPYQGDWKESLRRVK